MRDPNTIAYHLRKALEAAGEDMERPGIVETPGRWAKALLDANKGSDELAATHLKFFPNDGYTDLVKIENIDFHSTCEHHILPFFGQVDIWYYPDRMVLGLSKFPRIVDAFARRLQTQERMTQLLHAFLAEHVSSAVLVRVKAEHACVCSRGVEKHGIITETQINTLKEVSDAHSQPLP